MGFKTAHSMQPIQGSCNPFKATHSMQPIQGNPFKEAQEATPPFFYF
jgi:hypothetical protein